MDGKSLVRIAAVIFAAFAVTATALEMARKEGKPTGAVPQASTASTQSPLREGLRRCQVLGGAALHDGDCLRLWAEQRDRFLGSKAPSTSSAFEPAIPPSPDATTPEAR